MGKQKSQFKPGSAPSNWTTMRPHKYCGKMDVAGKPGKANKTHNCAACAAKKGELQRLDAKAMSNRREEKMGWLAFDDGE